MRGEDNRGNVGESRTKGHGPAIARVAGVLGRHVGHRLVGLSGVPHLDGACERGGKIS